VSVPSYPALFNPTTRALYPLRSAESFLVGRNETADVCVLDPTCSRHHFRIVRRDGRYHVEALAPGNPTYHDGQRVVERRPLEHGAVLQAGQVRFQFLLGPPGAEALASGNAQALAPPGPAGPPAPTQASLECERFPLLASSVLGREQGRVQVFLPHPQVSRIHARIDLREGGAVLHDLNSANGTFVNGWRVRGPTALRPGDQLDVGPYALQFTGTALVPRPRADNVELIARGVSRVVTNRETGKPLTLLDNISLVIRPREFVCLLGPSGSGKSTLLSALSGRAPADAGAVLLNGKDLYAHFDALKQDMAVVPQKDVLHEPLTVGQALRYTARLRLPPDTSPAEVEAAVSELLDTVGLTVRRGTLIRHLSGGQVKRASLANEVLCKPSLLFLDEVTSGLDEQTDREMMNLFRSLADAGKTVVCITHSLANVERACHLIVVLTAGGKLAFVGKPAEALDYFQIERLGDVYDRLAERPAEHWQAAFLMSPLAKRYVVDRLPPELPPAPSPAGAPPGEAGQRTRLFARQASLLTQRYFAIWLGDYPSLLAMAGQALLVPVLLGILFGDLGKVADRAEHARLSVNLLFLMAVSSFWFGCNNAAKEIVKERPIYTRERDFNLLPGSYYSSKLLLLTLFTWAQTLCLLGVVRAWCGPPGPLLSQAVVLLVLSFAGVTLGLAISAASSSEAMAVTLIPLAIIPQIILSGVIAPLSGLSKALAVLGITTYWGKRGLDACLPEDVAKAAFLEQGHLWQALLVLLLHAAVGAALALLLLHYQGRRKRGARA
jgi:ABC-type multidrug transport system ATPase subunit